MRALMLCLLLLLSTMSTGIIRADDVVDLGECGLKVTESREIESFKGEKGNLIKPSRRDAKFIELKVEGVANKNGKSLWYPQMFAAIFEYRGYVKIAPAVAIGIKFNDAKSGNQVEQWFNEANVSFAMGCEPGKSFAHYVIVEIPKEVTGFQLQGPTVIQSVELKK